jgi:hypothetical protein
MSTLHTAYITRDPDPVVLDGIRVPTLAALRTALDDLGAGSAPIIADLSLGAWRSHQVACEFCFQLGLGSPLRAHPVTKATTTGAAPPSHGDLVGIRIDAESKGDRTLLDALDLATRVTGAVGTGSARTFLVFAPRYGLAWEAENTAFLRFLAQGWRGSAHRVLLIAAGPEDPPLPAGWSVNWHIAPESPAPAAGKSLLGLVPGIAEPDVAAALDAAPLREAGLLLPLAAGCLLVAPECRRPPRQVSRLEYDKLARAARPFGWLEAYAQFFGNNFYVDPAFLSAAAKQRVAEGGTGIALKLLERAVACAGTPTDQGVFLAQLQGLRITLQRYQELAAAPDPSPAIWPGLRAILLESKAWGLTMLNEAARARDYFMEARRLLEANRYNREYLYLLNISALNELKLGDAAGALALEQEIEATLAQQGHHDWHLEFINSVNLARLYRRSRHFDEAEAYYRRAFATTLGVRAENDTLYLNVYLARLHMERGWAAEAFGDWLRTGLHWVSNSVPEALGGRLAGAILNHKLAPGEALPEAISAALLALLQESAQAAGLPAVQAAIAGDFDTLPAPVFARSDRFAADPAPPPIDCAVGAPGWSILTARAPAPEQFRGANYRRLRACLYALLQALAPVSELAAQETILVDDRLGHEMAQTRAELLDTCVRLAVPKMVFDGEVTDLDAPARARLEQEAQVRLGSAVAQVDFDGPAAVVSFKRYRPPLTLPEEESAILRTLQDGESLAALARRMAPTQQPDQVRRFVRALERERVLNLYIPENAYVPQRLVSSRL